MSDEEELIRSGLFTAEQLAAMQGGVGEVLVEMPRESLSERY